MLEFADSALPEFGETVVVFGLVRPTQQLSNPALWQAVGGEIVVTNLSAYTQIMLEFGDECPR